jgi:hypothetical protein
MPELGKSGSDSVDRFGSLFLKNAESCYSAPHKPERTALQSIHSPAALAEPRFNPEHRKLWPLRLRRHGERVGVRARADTLD